MNWIKAQALYLAWIVSLAAVLGSLYYGEILHIEPCRLCWFQRIGMFPLALFLGIAVYQNDRKVAIYCLPLILFGGLFALYQSLIQIFPQIQIRMLCGEGSPCTLAGYTPYLSLLAFSLIGVLILLSPSKKLF